MGKNAYQRFILSKPWLAHLLAAAHLYSRRMLTCPSIRKARMNMFKTKATPFEIFLNSRLVLIFELPHSDRTVKHTGPDVARGPVVCPGPIYADRHVSHYHRLTVLFRAAQRIHVLRRSLVRVLVISAAHDVAREQRGQRGQRGQKGRLERV